ncbi:MAG: bifunctional (p)ppGpp synthetase/guanosine-3',5'-bis(diphosphate) 3'-pyrophosphohydrolase [Chromatiales bacterium]|nr:bifunctional (p)ppGpp synthetase/guanosine-3',5'-bis(diphosphate) 3'-pyrophosphohydrolase [Chromatiales bacterium]MDH3945657.1 bifunctional (p)ppGpp synthetase/guanosine-3',5'-bis(diphosphate) 3'-pyrophosphohydrolase [Chromatiales bacterium]MDH4014170.1 bifunctional (p)ppGpp synthetase/guanosine-3',5'-bis(diphosphate) 3'-pyrophosphohydrolase [Chromatiales bacterium]
MDYAASFLARLPRGKRSLGLNKLVSRIETYLSKEQVAKVVEAYEFGARAHEGQKRHSGEPYITHPVAVATILADLHLDMSTLIAALLHDVIEDTGTDKGEISKLFGEEVANIVDGVSKLDQLRFRNREEAQAESFRKMVLAMAEDIRVILVKLADRTHNMQTLGVLPPAKRRRIARETLEIYAPIANRLGINSIRLELEELGFKHMHPRRHRVLERALRRAKGNQRQFLRRISARFESTLSGSNIEARVESREKHLYSIYRKMQTKGRSLAEIVDVFGFRVIVADTDDCYRALGLVHHLYKPMPGRFKDYIAIPRVNGYQSLHTTLFGPKSMPIEVQIRTEDMNRVAESGIAAHWQYKLGGASDAAPHTRAREWLKNLMEIQENDDSEEFLESIKVDLFPDKVYVFTPNGDIKRLPKGSTCVDFAYAVHTGVGNRCVAAKVDRRLVPLRTQLRNGQTVEVITARGATPNPSWVNFVVTAKARTAIRQFLKTMRRTEAEDLGRRLLDHALGEFQTSVRKLGKKRFSELLGELGVDSTKTLFAQIGLGERLAPLIAKRAAVPEGGHTSSAEADTPLDIIGTEGLVVSYARCCFPLPGDPIIGYLSAGRGIVVHRDDCGNLAQYRKQPEKWISVDWSESIDRAFTVEIRVEVINRVGVLAAVTSQISDLQTNIESVSIDERDGDSSTITFQIHVKSRHHLGKVLRSLMSMPEVLHASRKAA